MAKLIRDVMISAMTLLAGAAFAAPSDPIWMFSDTTGGRSHIFAYFRICDTARNGDFLCFAMESDQLPDTGDSYDGSIYINFDYQFSSFSPVIVKNEFDTTLIDYQDSPRPGYAGFKTAWDYGLSGFPISRYKYLVFAHKGPNPNHKVTVRCWYNNGQCNSPSFAEYLGTFNGSNTWKVDTIIIPAEVQDKPDKERNTSVYYELVFIINNINPDDTTSGPPGNLKIDEIRLVGCNPIDSTPKPQAVDEGQSATFRVYTSTSRPTDKLTYQWKKDGVDIDGATDSVYTIPSVTTEHAGIYTVAVTVSSTGLTFTSRGAPLTIGTGVIQENKRRLGHTSSLSAEDAKSCGCGSGTGLAFLPALWFKAMAHRRRKNRKREKCGARK